MSLEFEVVEDNLHVVDRGELTILENSGFINDYKYFWMSETLDYSLICEFVDVSSAEYPDGLCIDDHCPKADFPFLDYISLGKRGGELTGFVSLKVTVESWVSPYKAISLFELLQGWFVESGYECDIGGEVGEITLIVSFSINTLSVTGMIESFLTNAKVNYDLIDHQLTMELSQKLIIKLFKFPQQYEVICSQYLLWFGELLQSLGIDASVSTENKDGQTFLSIEPKDNTVLTSEIEKALYLYLSLPYSEYLPAASTNDNLVAKVEFQQLQHQIQMFQQQVEVKNSLLELKTAQLESNSTTNEALKKDLGAAKDKILLLESLKDSKLEMFEGAIALDEYKIGPVIINPKKIARLFGKKDT